MLNKNLDAHSVMGFATFEKHDDVTTFDLIEASLNWSHNYLAPIDGIGFHCLLQNTQGGFADIILAKDFEAFGKINEDFNASETSKKMMDLLKPDSVKLQTMTITTENFTPPSDFSCLEIGFMKTATAAKDQILEKSDMLEKNYLEGFNNTLAHFIGEIEPGIYTDVTFGRTLGETRRICMGFEENVAAQEFLRLFDPKSFDLDFWSLLA